MFNYIRKVLKTCISKTVLSIRITFFNHWHPCICLFIAHVSRLLFPQIITCRYNSKTIFIFYLITFFIFNINILFIICKNVTCIVYVVKIGYYDFLETKTIFNSIEIGTRIFSMFVESDWRYLINERLVLLATWFLSWYIVLSLANVIILSLWSLGVPADKQIIVAVAGRWSTARHGQLHRN